MKRVLSFTLIILLFSKVYGQRDSTLIFNEFCLSINTTYLADGNTENRYGFGIAAYHTFFAHEIMNVISGIEYNRTSLFKKNIREDHLSRSTNLTYYLNDISIPIELRVNFGKKIKIFIESGLFLDCNIGAKRKGTKHTYYPYQGDNIENKTFNIGIRRFNYGPVYGIGVKIPVRKFELVIKTDYKIGWEVLYDYEADQIINRYIRIMIGLKI